MRKLIIAISFLFMITSCSVGTHKDLITGLSISYNGFRIGETALVNEQGERVSSNEAALGTKLGIVVEDIEGYELKDDKVFPGLDLLVTDKDGVKIVDAKDLLASEEGYAPEYAGVLRGTVTIGDPMKPGETYHVEMKIWDKLKPESNILATIDLKVK